VFLLSKIEKPSFAETYRKILLQKSQVFIMGTLKTLAQFSELAVQVKINALEEGDFQ
jgi:hypothetical protein